MPTRWILAAGLLGLVSAQAATPTGTQQEQAACRPDVRKFCGQVQAADNDKYKQCLQSHFSELSQKCQEVLKRH